MADKESERERVLLRVIESQQQTIRELADRLMFAVGKTWTPPPLDLTDFEPPEEEEALMSSLHGLPPTWSVEENGSGSAD